MFSVLFYSGGFSVFSSGFDSGGFCCLSALPFIQGVELPLLYCFGSEAGSFISYFGFGYWGGCYDLFFIHGGIGLEVFAGGCVLGG